MEEEPKTKEDVEWEEITTTPWKPEKEGDNIEGWYAAIREDVGDFGSTVYSIQQDDRKIIDIFGNVMLDDLMKFVHVGTRIRITFVRLKPVKRGNMRLYKLDVARSPESRAEA